jgi:glycosyltransferase involved in cell wall biosynthesis
MNVYLFIQDNYRASAYGIGAYIRQLLCLAGKASYLYFTVIHLHSQEKTLRIEQEKDCRRIYLPTMPQQLANMNKSQKMNEKYLRNVAFVLKVIIPDNADNIFHFQFADQNMLVSRIKRLFVGKIVLTVHYLDWVLILSGDKKHCKQALLKPDEQLSKIEKSAKYSMERDNRLYSICDKVICISKSSQQSLTEYTDIQGTQLSLIPNALQDSCRRTSKYKIKQKYHISEYAKIILFVGRLDEMKGLICLLDAFGKLLASHPEAHLVIVGDGNFKAWIQ